MPVVTSGIEHARWGLALRSGAFFVVGGGLGVLVYGLVSDRSLSALPWGWLLFGAVVATVSGGLLPGRQRRR